MLRIPAGRQLYDDGFRELARGNLASARGLMSEAAKLQYVPAIAMYALMLEHGIGGRVSMPKAVHWLTLAAERGDSASSLRLAAWFIERENYAEAKHSLARVFTDPRAALLLAQLYSKSRSCRATTRAKRALDRARSLATGIILWEDERETLRAPSLEFRKRNPTYDPTATGGHSAR